MYSGGRDDWADLSADDQAFAARCMAVYASMASAMDYHIGRLLDYLADTGELDNTVLVFTSDNGPETLIVPDRAMAAQGYRNEYEILGEAGSMTYIGPNFANAAGETTDLKATNPALLQHMLNLYQRYAEEYGVQPVPAHYTQQAEINHQNLHGGTGDSLMTMLLTLITMGVFGLFAQQRQRLMRDR